MNKYLTTVAAISLISTSAYAQASNINGEVSAWGQGVLPTFGLEVNEDCAITGDPELCTNAFGYGVDANINYALGSNLLASVDILHENHGSTNVFEPDNTASYLSYGVHLTRTTNPDMPWGAFVFGASVSSQNADSDDAGPFIGAGAEIMLSGYTIQAGGLFHQGDLTATDTLENLYFVGVERGFQLGQGKLTVGGMIGFGDHNESATTDAPGSWVQANIEYRAPLGSSNLEWFVGYQGDFVYVDETGDVDQGLLNSVKLGISMPFGRGAGPFATPNFRAPLTNAGHLN